MITEAEANRKWCPLVREVLGMRGETAGNRQPGQDQRQPTCIGSACMAWRWERAERPLNPEAREGFCGQFGRPE